MKNYDKPLRSIYLCVVEIILKKGMDAVLAEISEEISEDELREHPLIKEAIRKEK